MDGRSFEGSAGGEYIEWKVIKGAIEDTISLIMGVSIMLQDMARFILSHKVFL